VIVRLLAVLAVQSLAGLLLAAYAFTIAAILVWWLP
jgi:hypothetical protein